MLVKIESTVPLSSTATVAWTENREQKEISTVNWGKKSQFSA